MAGPLPWEEYQQLQAKPAPRAPQPAEDAGPWTEYQDIPTLGAVKALPPDFSEVTGSVSSTADGRQADGWKAGVPRDLAFGARSVLQGIGSLLGAVGGDALGALETKITGRPVASFRDNAATLGDTLGLPKAQTAGDRVLGDIGEALTGTALTLGGGGALTAGRAVAPTLAQAAPAPRAIATLGERAGELLAAQPALQVASTLGGSTAAGVTRESGGGAGAQAVAGLLGGLAPSAALTGAQSGVRGLMRGGEAGRQQLEQAIDDFAVLGATPSVGQGTGRWSMQGAESLLSGGPTSGGVMRRFAEAQNEQIGSGLADVSNQLARNISGERAGRAIERGVQTFSKNTNAMRKALYWQADQHIPSDTPIGVSNTQRALADLTTPIAGAEATTGAQISPKIQQMAENLAQDVAAAQQAGLAGIPYEAVKRIRTQIGEELSDFSLSTDRPTAQLKRLYGSLSQDLEAAAQAQGPSAVAAVRRANNYFKASADRLETLERVVDKNGGPEKVFQAAMSGTKDGATTLRAVMRSLPEDGQKAVSAAVIKRMGLASPGAQNAAGDAFSPNTFLTNWGSLSPEARRTLFGRYGAGFSEDMDKIARVAERIKEGSEVFRNPSGTANRGAAFAYPATIGGLLITGQVGPAAVAVGGGAGANVLARAMTNPRFVKWLARSTELPIGAIPAQINVLKRMSAENDDDSIGEVAAALEASGERSAEGPQQ
ncbi:hypothetical protein B9Y88_07465 [Stenotrophomonas maltophilia]|uniref:hypothetical protein n=1 Tax=Stenotrophomonas TaxID=40323 RepID=UPI000C269B93|nr:MULTISPECIES: hypothetical protein [unclassified Stenotrophomonas]MDH1242550.1 hypothetical protein [Stenotrophomonas sp. GD03948]MDH1577102.1 hypothetical protein [Stenotrophomonas sp. GD03744]PJL78578.1 hypothetical protein B9Y88_07465 [Stenotrophomonas maltophilia]PZT38403.1 hypothetical protein A7X94_06450 [Stenotrophomonas maltophilia]